MICKQLEYLIYPSLSLVKRVRKEMMKMFDSIEPPILDTLKRFPKMYNDASINFIY